MNIKFSKISEEHRQELLKMMTEFYSSDAVSTNGSVEIFEKDIEECISNSPFLEGFIFFANEEIAGYSMLAHSFSTEFGKHCVLIEDIFIKKEYRHKGISTKFLVGIDYAPTTGSDVAPTLTRPTGEVTDANITYNGEGPGWVYLEK